MKTEQKLEVYRELFGSLPDVPHGKELVEIKCKSPKVGDYYYDDVWEKSDDSYDSYSFPVAIFQDTHRPDDTPLSIDPLPEPPKGYRVEYAGIGDVGATNIDGYAFFNLTDNKPKWRMNTHNPHAVYNASHNHYARLYKIAQPTTLADLVGEDGQKNFYILHSDGVVEQSFVGLSHDGLLWIQATIESLSFSTMADRDLRWSNDPFTKYADANEFVV